MNRCRPISVTSTKCVSTGPIDIDYNVASYAEYLADKPGRFESIKEASSALQQVLNKLNVLYLDLELDDRYYEQAASNSRKHVFFVPWLEAWERAFTSMLARSRPQMTSDGRKAAMVLKAHHLVAEILAEVDLSVGASGWSAFSKKFTAIVNLAGAILQDTNPLDPSLNSRTEDSWRTSGVLVASTSSSLTFALGIVDPLYEVGVPKRSAKMCWTDRLPGSSSLSRSRFKEESARPLSNSSPARVSMVQLVSLESWQMLVTPPGVGCV